MYEFDEEWLRRRLRALDKPSRLAFTVACAERTFGPYRLYAREAHRGRPRYLRSTLDTLWQLAIQRQLGQKLPFLDDGDRLIPLSCMQADEETEEACLYKEPHKLDLIADDPIYALLIACRCELHGDLQSSLWAANRDYELVCTIVDTLDKRAMKRVYRIQAKHPKLTVHGVYARIEYVQEELQELVFDIEELSQRQAERTYEQRVKRLRQRAQRRGRVLQGIVRSLWIGA